MEKRDLPGNDASWFHALLDEQGAEDTPPVAAPVQQLLLPVEESLDQAVEELPTTEPDEDLDESADESHSEEVDLVAPASGDAETPAEESSSDEHEEDVAPGEEVIAPLAAVAVPVVKAIDESAEPIEEPDAEMAETDAPDLVVKPPQLTGDTEPVHFPTEAVPDAPDDSGATPTPVAAVPNLPDRDSPVDNTSEMIGQLWTAKEAGTPLDDWAPDEMDSKITSSRPFRWTSVIAILAVIALIVVGLVLLPSITRSRADAHSDMMTTALWELRSELPDTQASLRVATEPESTVTALNDLSIQLTVLTTKASAVDAAGRADLPKVPPFTSSAPIDELVPIQQRLEPIATTAQTIQRRIANLIEYRTLMSGFMVLPELPTEADSATQADLRVQLASAQAESASILSDLPSDVSLSAHQAMARTINESFADWQIDYLEALRTEDPATAEALVAELSEALTRLDEALVTPLAQIRRQTDADLIDLARIIDEVRDLANGDEPTP